ncbi:MAG: N-acetylmuramoyl-L-alanine amidase [Romboutsia sp.]
MSNKNNKKVSHTRRRKRKLNPLKLVIVLVAIGVFLFGVGKFSKGIYDALSNIGTKKISTENQNSTEKQFDLGEEKKKVNAKYTVLVDPGHGGNDIGTESSRNVKNGSNNVYEKDIALEIAKKVASKLSKYNDIQVMITRTDDKFISLINRMNLANTSDVDVSVSIHLNAESGGNTATGVETYYRKNANDGSKELAKLVQETIISYVEARDRGTREENYDMVKGVTMPAVLVECGFLTTPDEEKKLRNDKYQDQLAEGIAQGILSHLDSKSKAQ